MKRMSEHCTIIQGGMGVGVSNWKLAQTVSRAGQLGVVSGTALDQVFARRLQDGDPGGHMQRALEAFPFPEMAARVGDAYFIAGGKAKWTPYLPVTAQAKDMPREALELAIVGNFAEVYLAKQGHANAVGINYLEKIQAAILPAVYGAMLAGVDYVLMGAGIPLKVPGVLDAFAEHLASSYTLSVTGALPSDDVEMRFDPADFIEGLPSRLKRPKFLAIVSSNTLATTMIKRANGRVDGLVVEMRTAGGHNAPPRGKLQLSEAGEPVYGERDVIDVEKLRELGVPFWLAGGYGHAEKLREALALGATGVQVGTAFEFADESGLREDYKRALLRKVITGEAKVFTDPLASPTNFPFKVAELEGTCSEAEVYAARPRICNLGFLREAYRTAEGEIDYRCPAEPVSLYVSKGGEGAETVGRKCICNSLVANVGYAQVLPGHRMEQGMVTAGDDLYTVAEFLPEGQTHYSAVDVIASLMKGCVAETSSEAAEHVCVAG
jgi:nitronate monooxygenase